MFKKGQLKKNYKFFILILFLVFLFFIPITFASIIDYFLGFFGGYENKITGAAVVEGQSDTNNEYNLPLGMTENKYYYNSTSKVMTDNNGLTYKTETNGVITVRGNPLQTPETSERYLAFAIRGNIDGVNYTYTSMDFNWVWHIEYNESSDGHIFWAENDNPNFIWRQYYYFYADPFKPMKIRHYLENNYKNITNAQMFYLTNVLENDVIEYNQTRYLVKEHIGLHKKGNFNDINRINFNTEYDFNFRDLIEQRFTINEFYIGNGNIINKPNINITAIGFTKNNGNFPKGSSVEVDPTFSTNFIKSISLAPLGSDKFVVAWCDETADDIIFAVYYTNETQILSAVDVSTNEGRCERDSVSTASFDSKNFVIGWANYTAPYYDNYTLLFKVYNISGNNLTGQILINTTGDGRYISVSAINSSTFIASWDYNGNYQNSRIYGINGTPITNEILIDDYVTTCNEGPDISAFNSTTFAVGYCDGSNTDDIIVKVYDTKGNNLVGETIADPFADVAPSVDVSVIDSRTFVVGWWAYTNAQVRFKVFDVNGTNLTTIKTAHDYSLAGQDSRSVSISAINTTAFVISWFESRGAGNTSFRVFNVNGTNLSNVKALRPTNDIAGNPVSVISMDYSTNLEICDDNMVLAWAQSGTLANWTAFNSTVTTPIWDGVCKAVPPSLVCTPPSGTAPWVIGNNQYCVGYNITFGNNISILSNGTLTVDNFTANSSGQYIFNAGNFNVVKDE